VVTFDPGKHRRHAPERHAPAGTPFSKAGLPRTPVDVAPVTCDSGTWAPEYYPMPRRRDMVGAALPAANQRSALTDPGPPSGAGPWPQWDDPPSRLHPDHPSAPVPRVRAEATAIREPADQEAARLRTVILSLSEQLSEMSAYLTENLPSSGGAPTALAATATAALMTARPTVLPEGPAAWPVRPVTRPRRTGSRHARPVTKPGKSTTGPARVRTAQAKESQTRGRQYQAMRVATAASAALFLFAAGTGVVEAGLHGFKFFTFRSSGTGETGPSVGSDQQFLAQQAAPPKAAAHKAHTPGRHSAKSASG
jgi:hypothetical protein